MRSTASHCFYDVEVWWPNCRICGEPLDVESRESGICHACAAPELKSLMEVSTEALAGLDVVEIIFEPTLAEPKPPVLNEEQRAVIRDQVEKARAALKRRRQKVMIEADGETTNHQDFPASWGM